MQIGVDIGGTFTDIVALDGKISALPLDFTNPMVSNPVVSSLAAPHFRGSLIARSRPPRRGAIRACKGRL